MVCLCLVPCRYSVFKGDEDHASKPPCRCPEFERLNRYDGSSLSYYLVARLSNALLFLELDTIDVSKSTPSLFQSPLKHASFSFLLFFFLFVGEVGKSRQHSGPSPLLNCTLTHLPF
jgi:hypothetical protein